ncbi:hypothetical protein SAMN05660841_02006 [Sphingobacterium nematocida]|uniref:Phospholipase_D-nuclease N-terminal n=1 Tax=Sphingobacterium nematocida TaxID=1513896 RepID=A0A1T5DIR2_9SPHI|nr:hypothetical protein [Sphingobacterium nematocida]SKB71604.1 hypothetical protein SAMN05660841_02006 [Sphingobacterium nematocida]
MKNLFHQTKQAFYFSLAFYLLTIAMMVLKVPFSLVLFSVSLLISMIWVMLVLREVMLSTRVNNVERVVLILFVILTNILGGIVYFVFVRERVIGKENIKK